ncbi:hypothetical protein [Polaribacter uvawellassae]|uniref:hypothetical protein n=1 Tax=Polaribacter uvawellassae TaxID=3133495 RepID=UPI00321909D2
MMLKTNIKILTAFFILSICFVTPTSAQFWKKIKNKVKNKVESKIDKKIDEALDGKKKESLNDKKDFKSYGSASINHSNLYGVFSVNDLTKTKVNKTGQKVKIIGYWRTSDADVFDGYNLTLNAVTNIENLQKKTFQIPEEATLSLAYNALVKGKYEYKKGEKRAPQILEVKRGTVTVTFNKDKNVSLNFSANVNLRDHNVEKEMLHRTPSTVNGTINTTSPEYQISKIFKKQGKKQNNTELTAEDKNYIKEKLSPTVNIPSSFSFNKSIELEFTDNRGEKQPMEFLLGNYPDIWAMSVAAKEMQGQGKVLMVMTPKSSTAFMDVAGMKMKKSTSLEQIGSQYNMTDNLPEDGDFEYKKTGKTKTILGYTCYEYRVDYNYTNSKGSSVFWVSKDFPIQNKQLPMLGMKMNNPYFDGFVLELNSNHNGKNYVIKVTNVSNKNISINTNEYRKMGF